MTIRADGRSFTVAGATVATFTAASVFVGPVLGRAIDRVGPRPVLSTAGRVHGLALVTVVFATDRSDVLLLGAAAVAGAAVPPVTASMRALWACLAEDPDVRRAAFSVEAVVGESVFLLGPLLVSAVVVLLDARAASWWWPARACAGSVGSGPAAGHGQLNPPGEPRPPRRLHGALGSPGLRVLMTLLALLFTAFGLISMSVTAAATQTGSPAVAGLLLAVWSAGSVLGALLWGARRWPGRAERQLTTLYSAVALAVLLLAASSDPAVLAGLLVLAGLPIAASATLVKTQVAALTTSGNRAEAYTWTIASTMAGSAVGSALGGNLVDTLGPGRLL